MPPCLLITTATRTSQSRGFSAAALWGFAVFTKLGRVRCTASQHNVHLLALLLECEAPAGASLPSGGLLVAAASLSGCLCLVSWWEPPGFAASPPQEAARCGPETASLCAAIAAVCTPCDSLQLSASAETNPGAVTNHNLGLGPVGAGGSQAEIIEKVLALIRKGVSLRLAPVLSLPQAIIPIQLLLGGCWQPLEHVPG